MKNCLKSFVRPFWHYLVGILARIKLLIRSLSRYPLSFWYGNTVLPAVNRSGLKNWQIAKSESNLPVTDLHKHFLREGYAEFGHIFDLDDINCLKNEFDLAINSDELSENPYRDKKVKDSYNYGGFSGDVEEYRRDIKDCEKSLPTVKKLFQSQKLKNLIQEAIGCKYYELSEPGFLAWRIYHVPQEIADKFEVNTNRFHFDDQMVDRFKIFIYLSDVGIDDGPFQHFPKNYSRKLLLKGFNASKRNMSITSGLNPNILNSPKLIKHVGTAGHALICATSFCLHRAGEPVPGHYRDLLQISVRPKQSQEQ